MKDNQSITHLKSFNQHLETFLGSCEQLFKVINGYQFLQGVVAFDKFQPPFKVEGIKNNVYL